MIKDNQKLLNRFLIVIDALLIVLAFSLSYFLKFSKFSPLIKMGFLVPKFGYFFPFNGYASALWFIVPGYLLI